MATLIGEAAHGRSALVRVWGQPGTGRTAFLAMTAVLARTRGLRVTSVCGAADGVLRPAGRSPSAPEEPGTAATGDAVSLLAGTQLAPAVVIVDDEQWIDPAVSSRLAASASRKREHGLLVVLAAHRSAPALTPGYDADLWLPPLSEAGVLALLAQRWPDPIQGGLVEDAVALTGGNPAVLGGVFSRLAATGDAAWARADFAVAASQAWSDLAARVLDGLPGDTVGLLRALAVWGDEMSLPLACELARVPVSPQAAADLLTASGLVVPDGGRGRLERPLAECVMGGMSSAQRRELSERATALGRAMNLNDEALARMLLRAGPSGQDWAFGALYDSALRVRAQDAGLAAGLLSRALHEPVPKLSLDRARLDLAAVQSAVNPAAAGRRLRQALISGESALPGSLLGPADLLLCQDDTAHSRSAVAAAQARPGLTETERAGLAGLYWLGAHHQHLPGPAEDTAVPALPADPDDPVQASVVAAMLAVRGRHRELACRLARRAIAAPTAANRPDAGRLLAPRMLAATVLAGAGEPAEAYRELTTVISDARRLGANAAVALALVTRADVLLGWGRPAGAAADVVKARSVLPGEIVCSRALPLAAAIEIELNVQLGRLEDAERAAAVPLLASCAGCSGWTRLLLARGMLALAAGRPAAGRPQLDEVGRRAAANQWTNPAFLMWRSAAGLAHHLLGSAEEATGLSSADIAAATGWGAPGPLGRVHLQAGWMTRSVIAGDHFRKAAAHLHVADDPVSYVRAVLDLAASAADQAEERATILASLREAAALAQRHCLGAFAERAIELARQYGGLPELSSSQLRVAELAAVGTSSAVIAAKLSLSRRTVEMHLTNVYRKLGIKGRQELAAALAAGRTVA
jgi:DNA-binding CsgD family transcriptional regulator